MRLIGSLSPLPAPAKPDTVNSSFVVKHITDYYVPNSKDIIFRSGACETQIAVTLNSFFIYTVREYRYKHV